LQLCIPFGFCESITKKYDILSSPEDEQSPIRFAIAMLPISQFLYCHLQVRQFALCHRLKAHMRKLIARQCSH